MQVRSLTTALKCLNLIDKISEMSSSVRISEMAKLIGESRATTYQRLFTLTEAGWLERLPDGSFRLTVKANQIGAAAIRQAGFDNRAQLILDELAIELGEAISLVLLDQEKLVIALRAESKSILRADLQVGAELSYKDSASGSIWLAFGPADLFDRARTSGYNLPSPQDIAKIRNEQLSVGGGGETLPGISAVAIPVLDVNGHCLGSLSTTCPSSRFEPERYLPAMRKVALKLTELSVTKST
jgi:IclR family acetate operon transcriptional repressor